MLILQYRDRCEMSKIMNRATLSTKYQISIPKHIRETMHLKAGQQFLFIPKGNGLYLIPVKSMPDIRGALKGANTQNIRDRRDRI